MYGEVRKDGSKSLLCFGGIIAVAVIVLITFFLLFASISVIVLVRKGSTPEIIEKNLHEYQYVDFNPKTSETSVGLVSIYEDLKDGDYVSYQNEKTGKNILISNINSDCGTEEYQCTGSCTCEKYTDERRTTTTILSRGLTYLLVAVTSYMAIEKAKEYFEEECKSQYLSDSCSSIQSSLDDCKTMDFSDFSTPKIAGHHFQKKQVGGGRKIGKYWCEGHCMTKYYKTYHGRENYRKNALADLMVCDEMEASGPISLEITNLTPCEIKSQMEMLIHAKFRTEILGPYCKSQSTVDWQLTKDDPDTKRKVPLCSSSANGVNPSITCVAKAVIVQDIQILDKME